MRQTSVDFKNLADHMSQQRYLLIEPLVGFAMSLKACLQSLGVPSNQIWMASKLSLARTLFQEHRPNVLITEFNLDRGTATELIDLLESRFSETERLVLITGHQPEIPAIADSAEDRIDGYLVKPYSIETFRGQILKSFIQKLGPSTYVQKIRAAEQLLSIDNLENAISLLDEAKSLDPKPARACFLKGSIRERQSRDEEALLEYRAARSFQPLHYKTLVSEFNLLIRFDRFEEASSLAIDLRTHFPVDANLLAQFFKCALRNDNLIELKALYQTYRELELRSPTLNDVAEDAFFRAGLRLVKRGRSTEAMEYFELGITTSCHSFRYLEKIINVLLQANASHHAAFVLDKVSPEDTSEASFHRLSFLVHQKTMTNEELLNRGRHLIFSGMGSPDIFRVVVKLFAEAGKETLAESAISKAIESYPDLRDPLYELLQTHLRKPSDPQKQSA